MLDTETPSLTRGELEGLLAALTVRDGYTAARGERTAALAVRVALELGLDGAVAQDVGLLARIADVGRLGLPDELVRGGGDLTPDQRAGLCEHPTIGAAMIRHLPGLARLAPLVATAHERWDGDGYPAGLAGEEIPLPSRIVHATTAYVAMISERAYRATTPHGVALGVVVHNAGTQFCPQTAQALVRVLAEDGVFAAAPEPEPESQPVPSPPPIVPARSRQRPRRRRRRWPAFAVPLAGLLVGVFLAFPLRDARAVCPPAGEGLTGCTLQKSWLAAITIVAACALGAMLLERLICWAPGAVRRRRQPPPPLPRADPAADPLLLAANWGLTRSDAVSARHPRRAGRWDRRAASPAPDHTAERAAHV